MAGLENKSKSAFKPSVPSSSAAVKHVRTLYVQSIDANTARRYFELSLMAHAAPDHRVRGEALDITGTYGIGVDDVKDGVTRIGVAALKEDRLRRAIDESADQLKMVAFTG